MRRFSSRYLNNENILDLLQSRQHVTPGHHFYTLSVITLAACEKEKMTQRTVGGIGPESKIKPKSVNLGKKIEGHVQ